MKKYVRQLIISVFSLMVVNSASAESVSVYGQVNFVGTSPEHVEGGVYEAQFRFRVINSTCGSDQQKKDRWIGVRSGRMDDKYQHNSVNFKNAYTTIMTAFISGKNVQIDGVPSCDPKNTKPLNLWTSTIGIY